MCCSMQGFSFEDEDDLDPTKFFEVHTTTSQPLVHASSHLLVELSQSQGEPLAVPAGVAVDDDTGEVYACDTGENRVQVRQLVLSYQN